MHLSSPSGPFAEAAYFGETRRNPNLFDQDRYDRERTEEYAALVSSAAAICRAASDACDGDEYAKDAAGVDSVERAFPAMSDGERLMLLLDAMGEA